MDPDSGYGVLQINKARAMDQGDRSDQPRHRYWTAPLDGHTGNHYIGGWEWEAGSFCQAESSGKTQKLDFNCVVVDQADFLADFTFDGRFHSAQHLRHAGFHALNHGFPHQNASTEAFSGRLALPMNLQNSACISKSSLRLSIPAQETDVQGYWAGVRRGCAVEKLCDLAGAFSTGGFGSQVVGMTAGRIAEMREDERQQSLWLRLGPRVCGWPCNSR
jgi:hypothetical protein